MADIARYAANSDRRTERRRERRAAESSEQRETIGERGRSSFSLVDCLKTVVMKIVVTRAILTVKTDVVTARLAFGTHPYRQRM